MFSPLIFLSVLFDDHTIVQYEHRSAEKSERLWTEVAHATREALEIHHRTRAPYFQCAASDLANYPKKDGVPQNSHFAITRNRPERFIYFADDHTVRCVEEPNIDLGRWTLDPRACSFDELPLLHEAGAWRFSHPILLPDGFWLI